jgi:hypothetical protein
MEQRDGSGSDTPALIRPTEQPSGRIEVRDGERVYVSESGGARLELAEDPDWTEGVTRQLLRLLFGPRLS